MEHHSQNPFYRYPTGAVSAGTEVTLKLSVPEMGSPVSAFLTLIMDNEQQSIYMPYITMINGSYVYSVKIKLKNPGVAWYYFCINTTSGTYYYGNNSDNLGGLGQQYDNPPVHSFQITVYDKNYHTPDWFKRSVAYQIFPDRFYNGNDDGSFGGGRTDIIRRKWGDMPYYTAEQFGGDFLANDVFGGNLKGIMKKLPYLKDLGIGAIYLNPIFEAYSNHKYDTGDYMKIDPMFGTEKDFQELCREAKKLGIRIILDGVFNHTGSDSRYFNKKGKYDSVGAYQSQNSPYYGWYSFVNYPEEYMSWWGMNTLPQVNEDNESYQEYILTGKDSVVKHWLKEGASGWRLDVVDELPDFFVKKLRKAVREQDEDAVIIGEVWEDASHKVSYGRLREYFWGDELDSVMNYPLKNALLSLATGAIDADGFHRRLMSLKENYPPETFYSLLNIMSTHDIPRALTVLGDAPDKGSMPREEKAWFSLSEEKYQLALRRMHLVSAVQILLPGVPCIYYGDEAGMQGYDDPFCRATYPWGEENEELREWFKKMIHLRNENNAFIEGELDTVYKLGRVYGFLRSKGNDRFLVIANFSDGFEHVRVDMARFGARSLAGVFSEEKHESVDGVFFLDIPQTWVKFFKVL